MIQRALHDLLWEVHGPSSYQLVGWPFWVELVDGNWRCRRDGTERTVICDSRDSAMEYVALAFETYGDSAA